MVEMNCSVLLIINFACYKLRVDDLYLTMQYREKILELIFDEDEEAFVKWTQSQPRIEQPDVLREYRQICIELIEAKGREVPKDIFDSLEQKTNSYEDAILNEQLASLKYDLALKERDNTLQKFLEEYNKLKDDIRLSIKTNREDKEILMDLAKDLIITEKENDMYDPETWIGIEEYL